VGTVLISLLLSGSSKQASKQASKNQERGNKRKRAARTGESAVGARVDVPHVLRDGVLVGGRLLLVQVLVDGWHHLCIFRVCVGD
jgi:hypothetical protein